MRATLVIGLLCAAEVAAADEPVATAPVVITATRTEQKRFEADRSVDVLTREQREERQSRSLPEALEEVPGVLVQSTNRGAGAPIIRGLIGPQNLILLDGVRFNTSTYRTGPLQYLSLLDPTSFEQVEVLRGPSSVFFGNGAMGGVMHLRTFTPEVPRGDYAWSARAAASFASADLAPGVAAQVTGGRGDVAWLVGGSYSHFDVLRTGDGEDQPLSEYDAGYWRAKVVYSPSVRWSLTGAYFAGMLPDSGRADGLGKGDVRTYDNFDHLAYVAYAWRGIDVVRNVRATASWQRLLETADQARCKTSDAKTVADRAACAALDPATVTSRSEARDTVDVLGVDASVELDLWARRLGLSVGGEVYQDFVGSSLAVGEAASGFAMVEQPRGNYSDDSRYLSAGVWADLSGSPLRTDTLEVRLNAGTRFSHFAAQADAVPGIGDVDFDFDGFVFTGGAQLLMPGVLNLYANYSQGFRAPNLQETTVLGDTGKTFEVPNPDLRPERSDTIEAGLKLGFGPIELTGAYFMSFMTDAITTAPAQHQGQDQVSGKDVRKRVNADGFYQGVETGLSVSLYRLTLSAALTWIEGDLEDTTGQELPASRVPPLFGTAALRYDLPDGNAWVELSTRWAAAQDRLSAEDKKDQRICQSADYSGVLADPCSGTSGWVAVGVRGGWRPHPNLRWDLSVQNVADADYRVHGSGVDAPGVDARTTLTAQF